jgi:hypothetical protein
MRTKEILDRELKGMKLETRLVLTFFGAYRQFAVIYRSFAVMGYKA